ncbi:glutamate racemase [Telmatospirillum sp. J64-1]|uniref:glutamate racemase n=1 Tax=Telmatospirillum sp. J64-1 TaxID=2502183 RepID=UPI00115CC03B|nr:glutamate racemase [Telmatospirillum sp. J64-1]
MRLPSPSHPIGIFDSGVGGLTVLRALRRRLPHEDLIYLGDTARLPYGTKSPETVRNYAVQAARLLVERNVKMLVVACNTASAHALEALRAEFPHLPVIGVVEPGASAACAASLSGRILVIATESTVQAGAYDQAIRRLRPDARVASRPCPLFVSLAEEGLTEGEIAEAVARHYLDPLLAPDRPDRPDCLVLGCTHFPAMATTLAKVAGPGIILVDSASTTAESVAAALSTHDLAGTHERPGRLRYLATDAPGRFARVAATFLPWSLDSEAIELVDLR